MKLMKISLVSFLSILLVLLAVIACQEQDAQDFKSLSEEGSLKSSTTNPYDYVGQFHNEALLDFANHPNFPNLSPLSCINIAENLYIQKGLPFTTLPTASEKQIYATKIGNLPSDGTALLATTNDLYTNGYINLNVRNALLQIHNTMQDTRAYNQASLEDAFSYLIANLNKLEKQFLEANYTQIERANILPIISIAKYSLIFWKDAEINSNNPYYNSSQLKGGWFRELFKAIAIGAADAAGGAIGGLIGSGWVSTIMAGVVGGAASYGMRILLDIQ